MTAILQGKLIQIPAERGVFKEARDGLIWIRLPLVAGRTAKLLGIGLGLVPIGAIFIIGALMFAPELMRALLGYRLADDDTVLSLAFVVPTCIAAGAFFAGVVLACLADFSHQGPLLTIDDDGIIDIRTSATRIAWDDIARARIIHLRTGIGGVHLRLKRPGRFSYNPFRLGTMAATLRRRPDEVYMSLALLSLPAHMLAHATIAMVRAHGGETDTRSRFDVYGLSS